MWILDTDRLSLLQRENLQLTVGVASPLENRLLLHQKERVVITIVTAEEQLRGRLSVISKASNPAGKASLPLAYQNLRLTIESLQEFEQIDFDPQAELIYHQLREQKIRIGTQDLRIASIALANRATLLTRNYRDFVQVPNLIIDDWTK
jgi:tRNA(fMet)-specific endonuclease VapC